MSPAPGRAAGGGQGAPGRAPRCVRVAAIMASPSAPRSPQGWGGGEADSPPLPGGASRPDH